MFLRETVQHCSVCEETTPHCRRVVPVLKGLCVLALVGAGWCFLDDAFGWPFGVLLLVAAVYALLFDRERHWGTHCVRCRGKLLAEVRRSKPTLDGNTEINVT